MVRILIEISLPAQTVARVSAALAPGGLGPGVAGQLQTADGGVGCQSPAVGGEARWTPCWICLEAGAQAYDHLAEALPAVKALLADACREAGLGLLAVPANVQIGDEYYRLRDLLEAVTHIRS